MVNFFKAIGTLAVLLCLASCGINDEEIGSPQGYFSSERTIHKDCTIYQMRFSEGPYIFRFAQAGPCKQLIMGDYIKEYSDYLAVAHDSLTDRKGFILLEYYGFEDTANILVDSLISITEKGFGAKVTVSEKDEQRITLEVKALDF